MIHNIKNSRFSNTPLALTEKVIRRHFPHCEACVAGNMARRPASTSTSTSHVPIIGEEIELDIKVFADHSSFNQHKKSMGGHTCVLTAIDVSSGYHWGHVLRSQSHLERILELIRLDIAFYGRTLKTIRTDNQFITSAITAWARDLSHPPITLLPCIPHEHFQIGLIERFNRTLEDSIVKNMYNKPHITVDFWAMCYEDVIMKANIVGSLQSSRSPYELWTGKTIDMLQTPMLPFGAIVMAHIPLVLQESLGPRSVKTYAIGISLQHDGGLLLFNPSTKRVIIRRTFKTLGPSESIPTSNIYDALCDDDDTEDIHLPLSPLSTTPEIPLDPSSVDSGSELDTYLHLANTLHWDAEDNQLYKTIKVCIELIDNESLIVGYRRPVRENGNFFRKSDADSIPIHIGDIQQMTNTYANRQHTDIIATRAQCSLNNTPCRVHFDLTPHIFIIPEVDSTIPWIYKSYSKIDRKRIKGLYRELYAAFLTIIDIDSVIPSRVPRTMRELHLLSDSNPDKAGYFAALASEIQSLKDMSVYQALPPDVIPTLPKNQIGSSKLIFTKKMHPDGTFDKFKCRLVFRGDRFVDAYNNKTYSGTVMSESVRLMFAIIAEDDLEMLSLDVKTAFLYAPVPTGQTILMRRPTGLSDTDMPEYVSLNKCLYGLPMAPAQFRAHSDSTLRSHGFLPLVSDPRIYIKLLPTGDKLYVLVHVDDFLCAGRDMTALKAVCDDLALVYQINISTAEHYVGMHVTRDRSNRTITLAQPGYIDEMIDDYQINCTSFPATPMIEVPRVSSSHENPALSSKLTELYQSKVGSLLFLANQTRPDILFAVNMASRHSKSPTEKDMVAVDRILQYAAGTSTLGLTFHSGEGIILYGSCDASYGNHDDRKSHSGVTLHIGRNSGSFLSRSKKQTVTADSSTVAEFIAAHVATKEIMWARSLLGELGYPQILPTVLLEDNMSTIHMINNDCNSQKTKHIDIRYNLIREQVKTGNVIMHHLSTHDMISDILTKPIPPGSFAHLRSLILGRSSSDINKIIKAYVTRHRAPVFNRVRRQ